MSLPSLIDDYLDWFLAWHLMAATPQGTDASRIEPPASFDAWRKQASLLAQDQPAVEKLVALQDQLHRLARLVLMNAPETGPIARKDDESVTAKYREFMQGLRRLERAFAAADAGLDPLTGLQARARLLPELNNELHRFARTGRSFCVAIMDIDHFKTVNDTYGHEAGDRVLAAIANHISRNMRAHDDAYRIGGEEFLLCLKEATRENALHAVERLRSAVAQNPITLADGASVAVTASFGLAPCANMSVTVDDLMRRADRALYKAKNEGRNRIIIAD